MMLCFPFHVLSPVKHTVQPHAAEAGHGSPGQLNVIQMKISCLHLNVNETLMNDIDLADSISSENHSREDKQEKKSGLLMPCCQNDIFYVSNTKADEKNKQVCKDDALFFLLNEGVFSV